MSEREGGSSPSATSRSLLAQVQANESDAWERLVNLYAPLVLHWCRCGGLQHHDVADVFQEVFQSVVACVGRFRKERERDTFRGWLRRITQNKLRDHFRRLAHETRGVGGSSARERLAQLPMADASAEDLAPDQLPVPGTSAEYLAPKEGECGLFARALDQIRGEFEERTWSAFWRTAVECRAAQDVAADLAMTPGAVRVAKSRVLRRLREELGDFTE